MGASDDSYTWDAAVPTRAVLADLGGAQLKDEPPNPDQGSDYYAGLGNELQRQMAGVNRVICAAIIWVRLDNSNVPFIYNAFTMGSSAKVTATDFTVVRASGSPAGVFKVSWAANKLPAQRADPEVFYNTGPGMAPWGIIDPANANGVIVSTYDASGVLSDQRFGVKIY